MPDGNRVDSCRLAECGLRARAHLLEANGGCLLMALRVEPAGAGAILLPRAVGHGFLLELHLERSSLRSEHWIGPRVAQCRAGLAALLLCGRRGLPGNC